MIGVAAPAVRVHAPNEAVLGRTVVCDAFGVGDVEFPEAAPVGAFESPEAAGSVPGIPSRVGPGRHQTLYR